MQLFKAFSGNTFGFCIGSVIAPKTFKTGRETHLFLDIGKVIPTHGANTTVTVEGMN